MGDGSRWSNLCGLARERQALTTADKGLRASQLKANVEIL